MKWDVGLCLNSTTKTVVHVPALACECASSSLYDLSFCLFPSMLCFQLAVPSDDIILRILLFFPFRLSVVEINRSTDEDTLSQIRLEKLGYIQQSFNLLGSQTALQNVEIPMILHGVLSKDERQNRAKRLEFQFRLC